MEELNDYFHNQAPKTEVRCYELHGQELADYVEEEYRRGALGLGLMFRCFRAWIAYKFHK